jgi:DNA-binding LacI/PurR family transcriptional regulator
VTARRHPSPQTLAELGRIAGVSASTVSRALSGSHLVDPRKRARLEKLARQYGYVGNPTARNLRLGRTQTLGVVVRADRPDVLESDPAVFAMLGNLANEVARRGYGVLLRPMRLASSHALNEFIGSRCTDGVIVIAYGVADAVLHKISRIHAPLVVWGAEPGDQRCCTVTTDHVAGARAAVEHLLTTGRRRIAFLGSPQAHESGRCYGGYTEALATAGRPSLPPVVPADASAAAVHAAVRAYLRGDPACDALLAATDLLALSAIRAITVSGLSVPEDVAVVGFDGIPAAAHANPPLTTVGQDLNRCTRLAVELLLRRVKGEEARSVVVPPLLVVRESSVRRGV